MEGNKIALMKREKEGREGSLRWLGNDVGLGFIIGHKIYLNNCFNLY